MKKEDNRLCVQYPYLVEELATLKNDAGVENLTCWSNKKVWWKCDVCGHEWLASIKNRVVGTGCPACAGRVATDINNLAFKYPHIANEWSNRNKKGPEEYTCGSNKKVIWKCSLCGHEWEAYIFNRVRGTGCPECAKPRRKICTQKKILKTRGSLLTKFPELCKEWSSKNKIGPEKYTSSSGRSVWWVCKICTYEWLASINNRTFGKGCPACTGKVATKNNNLVAKYPDIAKEWSERNVYDPSYYTPWSHKKVWWVCLDCCTEWEAAIKSRINGSKCPLCTNISVSQISQVWLDSLQISGLKREYFIKEIRARVDGYDPETNTVYEFLGDYWHGNPEVYNPRDKNSHNKKSFGQLYKDTFNRLRLLEEAGFKVIYIWEKNYVESR